MSPSTLSVTVFGLTDGRCPKVLCSTVRDRDVDGRTGAPSVDTTGEEVTRGDGMVMDVPELLRVERPGTKEKTFHSYG